MLFNPRTIMHMSLETLHRMNLSKLRITSRNCVVPDFFVFILSRTPAKYFPSFHLYGNTEKKHKKKEIKSTNSPILSETVLLARNFLQYISVES